MFRPSPAAPRTSATNAETAAVPRMTTLPAILAAAFTALVAAALVLAPASPAPAFNLNKALETITGPTGDGTKDQAGGLAGLSESEMVSGLKQALDKAVGRAVSSLGRMDGYLKRPEVKIPMPGYLVKAENLLRSAGQGQLADDFVTSLNRAAETAAPEAASVLISAVKAMTLADAKGILQGPEDAATRYFERTSRRNLAQRLEPIVSRATAQADVTGRYKALETKATSIMPLLGIKSPDLDGYVTKKALDGLFVMMAREESLIRANPAARTTDLLKKVFGAL